MCVCVGVVAWLLRRRRRPLALSLSRSLTSVSTPSLPATRASALSITLPPTIYAMSKKDAPEVPAVKANGRLFFRRTCTHSNKVTARCVATIQPTFATNQPTNRCGV